MEIAQFNYSLSGYISCGQIILIYCFITDFFLYMLPIDLGSLYHSEVLLDVADIQRVVPVSATLD
jgi:hypothetical protein